MHKTTRKLGILIVMLATVPGVSRAEEALRDPTRPYAAAERVTASSPRIVVNAIIVSDDRRVAIVNGRRVGIGSSIGSATVIAIEKDQLVLEVNGKRVTAGLNEGAMRR